MLCQNCNEREANVRYTQVINGDKTEMNLCDKCAGELGIGSVSFNMPLSFSSMFGDFLEPDMGFVPMLELGTMIKCPNCGMKYDEFAKLGKFGCPMCYDTFSYKIEPMLKRLHGSTDYMGKRKEKVSVIDKLGNSGENKVPVKKRTSKEEKIVELKDKLKELIKKENYEEAAVVRDEIKKLEGGNK